MMILMVALSILSNHRISIESIGFSSLV